MAKASKMNRRKVHTEDVMKLHELATTADMVVEQLDKGRVLAEDDKGKYVTFQHFVDTGLLDPYRSPEHRREPYVEPEAPAAEAEAEAAESEA